MADPLTTCDTCGWIWNAHTWTRCPRCMGTHAAYEPDLVAIRAACLKIQAGWTRKEERKRRATQPVHAEIKLATRVCYRDGE
jgi:hypothetical protein